MLQKILHTILTTAFWLVCQYSSAQLNINSVTSSPSTCANNGSISVSASSSNPPLLYSIQSGPTTQAAQTNSVFNSMLPGNYVVKIADGAGNNTTRAITVQGTYVNPAFNISKKSPKCVGGNDGQLEGELITGTGLAPYTWQLLPPSPVVVPPQTSNHFNNLVAGDYTIRTIDACGSVSTQSMTILPPNTSMIIPHMRVEKSGCDSLSVYVGLTVNFQLRMPLSFSYETSNGTFVPTSGTIIDSNALQQYGSVTIIQTIPGLTYGDYLKVTVTNSCGDIATSDTLHIDPFVFYPKYAFNECGNEVTSTYVNSFDGSLLTMLKAPITFTYTDLSTNSVVQSGTSNYPWGATIDSTVAPGGIYRLTLTDGCGQTYSQDYLIPFQSTPAVIEEIWSGSACIDSVVGLFRISTTGLGLNSKLILLSGPATFGSTKPEFSYNDTYSYPDTLDHYTSNNLFFISNLAVGTYTCKFIDDCGNELLHTFSIVPQQVTNLTRNVRFEKGCPGKNKIFFGMKEVGKGRVKRLSDNTEIKVTTFWDQGGINIDSILNVPSGKYEITFEFENNIIINPINDNQLNCWKIIDTIIIPPYRNPEISTNNSIMCNNQMHIELVPDTSRGIAPYQYEIILGPQTFPLQNFNVFTVHTAGTYYARIFDACGNASIKQITVDTIAFEPISITLNCNNTKMVFPSSAYTSYSWIFPNGQTFVGDSVNLSPVTPADTGTYHISKITQIGTCTDTLHTSQHVGLNNHLVQNIRFCEGTSVVVGQSTYHLPGIYHDTILSAAGCDSIVVTTLTVIPKISDTTDYTICRGDSIQIHGHFYANAGTYIDSVRNTAGCYDIKISRLHLQDQIYPRQITICNGDSYQVGSHTYHTSGIYTDSLQSVLGCDSIVILTLTVRTPVTHDIYQSICQGNHYSFAGNPLTIAGIYKDTLATTLLSCDSIVTLHLTVNPYKYNAINTSICEGTALTFGGNQLTTAGIYTDTLTTSGCDSIVTLTLTILPKKRHDIYAKICQGQDYVFAGTHYRHTGNYATTFPTSTCDSIVILHLEVTPEPDVHITSTAYEIEGGAYVELNAVSNTSPLTYAWTSSGTLSDYTIRNPTTTLEIPTWVSVTVTDSLGCSSTTGKMIGVPVTSTLYVPNSFTPDGDETNQVFRVYGTNIAQFEIIIFDRWGEIIFESTDFHFSWDATYKGVIVQDGTYVYKILAMGTDNVVYDKKGHITVIK